MNSSLFTEIQGRQITSADAFKNMATVTHLRLPDVQADVQADIYSTSYIALLILVICFTIIIVVNEALIAQSVEKQWFPSPFTLINNKIKERNMTLPFTRQQKAKESPLCVSAKYTLQPSCPTLDRAEKGQHLPLRSRVMVRSKESYKYEPFDVKDTTITLFALVEGATPPRSLPQTPEEKQIDF